LNSPLFAHTTVTGFACRGNASPPQYPCRFG
jgi:hypothetical protein